MVMFACDDCDLGTPIVDGWHVRPADPEGIEGIVRLPCPNHPIRLDYDFNSPPEKDGLYRVLVEPGQVEVGQTIQFGEEYLWAPGRVVQVYVVAIVEPTGPIVVVGG